MPAHVELTAFGIHWPEIDEDLSVAGMLAGVRPTYRWLRPDERKDRSPRADMIHDR